MGSDQSKQKSEARPPAGESLHSGLAKNNYTQKSLERPVYTREALINECRRESAAEAKAAQANVELPNLKVLPPVNSLNSQTGSDAVNQPKIQPPVAKPRMTLPLIPITKVATAENRQNSAPAGSSSYKWTNSSAHSVKTVDFDEILPNIKKGIAGHANSEFIKLNKCLSKNQPLNETRKSLVNNPYLADVKFHLGRQEFYGHKVFLISASLLFHRSFMNANEMTIDSVDGDTFLMLLKYCYTSYLRLTQQNVLQILIAANRLEIRQVTNICHGFISNLINNDSVFEIFEKAVQHNDEFFQKKCLDYITENEQKCFNSKGFFAIKILTLTTILQKCNFDNSKSGELIEKWNNGVLASTSTPALPTVTSPPKAKVTGAKPKQTPKNKQQPPKMQQLSKIPALIDLVVPSPPHPEGPTSSFCTDLISFDDDDNASIITQDENDIDDDIICMDDDDEECGYKTIAIRGNCKKIETTISRVDFVTKRPFALHTFWFNENLFESEAKEVRILIFNESKRINIHRRVVRNNKPGMKLNFVKFTKMPLKFAAGQKWFIKLNFVQSAPRIHLNPESLSETDMIELQKGGNKKFFNCISKLVISELN